MSSATTAVAVQYRLKEWAEQIRECQNRPAETALKQVASLSIPHHLKDCRKQRHGCGFRYVDGKTIYRDAKPLLYTAAALCILLQETGVYRDNLLRRSLRRKVFQTCLPYAAQPVNGR